MAEIQPTTTTTPNPSSEIKEAVGKNTKWNGKLLEPPLKGRERSPLSTCHSFERFVRIHALTYPLLNFRSFLGRERLYYH
jgi:hypothetical protein